MPAEGFDRALGAFYQLEELIGRGAAGEVWRGTDRRTGDPIAAKLLRPEYAEDHELVGRFLRERTILVGLRHRHIVAVRDLVAEGDRLAIVMEYVDGGSLRTALADGPLTPQLAARATAAVLDALALAHRRRVLHRDVKPDNVLLTADWQVSQPIGLKLSDFGVSSLLGERGGSTTGLVGTPEYMAPEVLLTGAADLPADVYAAGVLLYELLSGRTPFAGKGTGYVVAHRHVTNLPPRLPVPEQLWAILEALLGKDPGKRPTAADAAGQLTDRLSGLADLPALESQHDPETFATAGEHLTEVRGLVGVRSPPADEHGDASASAGGRQPTSAAVPDLGERSGETILRPMPVAVPAPQPEPEPERAAGLRGGLQRVGGGVRRMRLRSPQVIAAVLLGALLVGVGIYWLVDHTRQRTGPTPSAAPTPITVQQQSEALPTGLGIARSARWDAQSATAELSITYSAQRAPLRGPFLEVLPGSGSGACPEVVWKDTTARPNLSSVSGIDAACAWAIEPGTVPARGSVTVTATVALAPPDGDPTAALQQWLQTVGEATQAATSDSETTSTAYPAQRLTDIQVVAPSRTVSGKTLRLSLLPVWPKGVDQLNPLFVSPPSGPPTTTLVAVAGGTSGVRFGDGCGALSVSGDGLVVSAESVEDSCQVNATVGNFTDLASNSFAITTRGS